MGQYDSPFVRRVAVALNLLGFGYEHRPWSVFSDADAVARINPLTRVPTVVLDDGTVLIESAAILDYIDEVAEGPRLIPERGPERRRALQVCALGTGLAEKSVSLVYEQVLHTERSAPWVTRCAGQIERVLAALEASRDGGRIPFWSGDAVGHADIAVACAVRFTREAHPALFDPARWPHLADHAARCEALAPFQAAVQPFSPPR